MSRKKSTFSDTTPILPVNDVRETARFYQERLGFTITIVWENPNYAVVRLLLLPVSASIQSGTRQAANRDPRL